jgi:CBS domain-containing protein
MRDPVLARLFEQIGETGSVEELRSLRDQSGIYLESLSMLHTPEQFNRDLNEVHDALIRRAVRLSEQALARAGMGSPPVPYAYLLFGSGGRQEQTLSSDQDSGLLYDDPEPDADGAAVKAYFAALAQQIVSSLQSIGYPPCEGEVISTNPEWCDSLSGWRAKLDRWFSEAHWEVVRYLLIVADGRMVYGDHALAERLYDHYYQDALDNPIIVRRMLDNTMRHKVLIGVFGQLLRERYGEESGSLDIKYGAYIPMVNAIRLLAIQSGIRASSTFERIDALVANGRLAAEEADAYRDAFRFILGLRTKITGRLVDGMYANNGKLARSQLTLHVKKQLRHVLRVGQKLQRGVYRQTIGKLR